LTISANSAIRTNKYGQSGFRRSMVAHSLALIGATTEDSVFVKIGKPIRANRLLSSGAGRGLVKL
jgi:hypothetical protein